MVSFFETSIEYLYPWPVHVFAAMNKYPNPKAPHVVSVDVVNRQLLDDGSIRSERIIGVQQDAPGWVRRLLGSLDTTYVREVSFIVPSGTPVPEVQRPNGDLVPSEHAVELSKVHLEPPKLLMSSTNLSLSQVMQCRESISYKPCIAKESPAEPIQHPSIPDSIPNATLFKQTALIYSTCLVAADAYPPKEIALDATEVPFSKPAAPTFPQRAIGRRIETWSVDRFESNAAHGKRAMEWAAQHYWNTHWKNSDF